MEDKYNQRIAFPGNEMPSIEFNGLDKVTLYGETKSATQWLDYLNDAVTVEIMYRGGLDEERRHLECIINAYMSSLPVSIAIKPVTCRFELEALIMRVMASYGNGACLNMVDLSNMHEGEDLSLLFAGSTFDGELGVWDMRRFVHLSGMFLGCPFKGDLSRWKLRKDSNRNKMFLKCPIPDKHKPKIVD